MILIKILGGGDVFKYSGELCRNFLCKVYVDHEALWNKKMNELH